MTAQAVKPIKTFLLIVLAGLLASTTSLSQPTSFLNGKVVRVTDGDTLWVQIVDQFEWVQVRFYGVDAPECEWPDMWPSQPYSSEAKKFVIEQVSGKQVSIRLKDDETYGRVVGEVFVNGKSLSRGLLQRGLAWWNKKYEPNDLDLKRLQEEARSARLGLWSQENPVPPWEHRRKHASD